MTGRSDPEDTQKITRLLLKAVRALPEEEQNTVFEYFFTTGVSQRPGLRRQIFGPELAQTTVFTAQSAGPNQQIIPVRLSEDSHRRLKTWCADHDFHMSVVVRGLIERFLGGCKEPGQGGSATG